MSDAAVCAGAEEVLERYAATVFAAAYAMVKNKEDAEDIAQEVFISYVKAKPAFESAEHEKAWLLRVTINRCKSFFRSAWQRKTTGLEDDFPDTPFTPDETAVVEAVNRLPKKYRQVIYYIILRVMPPVRSRPFWRCRRTRCSRSLRGRANY
ncbi:MAG: sigma factor [Ruthenibacterium lactatiformans]